MRFSYPPNTNTHHAAPSGGSGLISYATVEASYLDSGSVNKVNAAGSFKTEPHMVTVTGLGVLPITEEFSLFARAGLAHWWYNADFTFPEARPTATAACPILRKAS